MTLGGEWVSIHFFREHQLFTECPALCQSLKAEHVIVPVGHERKQAPERSSWPEACTNPAVASGTPSRSLHRCVLSYPCWQLTSGPQPSLEGSGDISSFWKQGGAGGMMTGSRESQGASGGMEKTRVAPAVSGDSRGLAPHTGSPPHPGFFSQMCQTVSKRRLHVVAILGSLLFGDRSLGAFPPTLSRPTLPASHVLSRPRMAAGAPIPRSVCRGPTKSNLFFTSCTFTGE